MQQVIVENLPWLLSGLSLIMMIGAGNNWRRTWVFGIGLQFLWLLWIYCAKAWGFLPLTLSLFIVYTRNHMKWNHMKWNKKP